MLFRLPAVETQRVPVEHRFLGLDRRTFPFAGAALAVWLLWAVVVPAVDDAVPWHDVVRAGDVLQLTDSVTMVPVAGWGLRSGLRTTDRTRDGATSEPVVLTEEGVTLQVTPGPWAGSPTQLLVQSARITGAQAGPDRLDPVGGTTTVQTREGDVGVLEAFSTPVADGLIAAFVFDGQGLQIEAFGTPEHMAEHAGEISAMIASIGRGRS